jgi:hypothetical protein
MSAFFEDEMSAPAVSEVVAAAAAPAEPQSVIVRKQLPMPPTTMPKKPLPVPPVRIGRVERSRSEDDQD